MCLTTYLFLPDSITLIIAKFSVEELTLPKGTIHGVDQEISKNLVVSVSYEDDADRGTEQIFFFLETVKSYVTVLRSI